MSICPAQSVSHVCVCGVCDWHVSQVQVDLVHGKRVKRKDDESKLVPHWYPAHEVSCIVPLHERDHDDDQDDGDSDSDDGDDEERAGLDSTPGAFVLTKPDRLSEFDRYRSANADGADPLRTNECAAGTFKSVPGDKFVPRLCTLRPLLVSQAEASEFAAAAVAPDPTAATYLDGLAQAIERGEAAAATAEWSHLGRIGHLSLGSIVLSAQHGICEVIDHPDQEPPIPNWVRFARFAQHKHSH